MTEDFLHYVWKFQKWESSELIGSKGEPIVIINPGFHNKDSGPDFEEARVKIGNVEWAGSIEIHLRSSDWSRHHHSGDPAYDNVVLHVVYEHDLEIKHKESEVIPTLELKGILNQSFINNYQTHVDHPETIACGSQLSPKMDLSYSSMLDKVLVERLEKKAQAVFEIFKESREDWESTCYQMIVRNFGFSVNQDAFKALSKKLNFSIIKQNLHDPFKTEALLFGQAGFLIGAKDDYQRKLKREYNYLSAKYRLPDPLIKSQWKFGKIRPPNFPSVRLSQLSGLLSHHPKLFHLIVADQDTNALLELLKFKVSEYWKSHYDFGKGRKRKVQTIGKQTFENLLINSVAPVMAAFSKYSGNDDFMNRAISILELLSPEQNRITKLWAALDKKPTSAFASQAQIQLVNDYCTKRKCLSCAIGVSILSND